MLGPEYQVKSMDLYDDYKKWWEENRERELSLRVPAFLPALVKKVVQSFEPVEARGVPLLLGSHKGDKLTFNEMCPLI